MLNPKSNILFLVVGASGSGKTYIINKLCQDLNLKQVYSATTRKQRYKNEIGHIFVSREQAKKDWDTALAKTNYNDEMYYTTVEMVQDKDFYVIDPYGVRNFNRSLINKPVQVLYIKSPWYVRAFNMFKRGDKIKSIIKRLLLDRKEFKNFKIGVKFKSSNELYDYIDRFYS